MFIGACTSSHGRRARRIAPLLAALSTALAAASCTPRGEGGLPARPLRSDGVVAPPVPMSLTASDGTGLRLVSLKARGVVEEPLAFTELHLVFENPTDRTIEGRFEINMPPDAAISRFAMKIHGNWNEGEVVERRAAQVAFEDALHRKQDPALLENKAGNAFSARVFPILPRERKELIVAYSQELTSSAEPYRLLLRGLPELEELDASVILRDTAPGPAGLSTSLAAGVAQTRVIELKQRAWVPDQDLEVRSDRGQQVSGLRHHNLAVARIAPAGAMPAAPVGGLTVLFDTSASRALDFDRQIAGLAALLGGLREQSGEDFTLRVVAFDQTTAEIYAGPASGFGRAHVERLSTRRALGASDLRQALAAAAIGPVLPRLLVLSDGVATAGPSELGQLELAAEQLAAAGVQRIDALVDGGIQDASTLRAITTADMPQTGVVADGRLPVAVLAHKLASRTLADMRVSVPGAAWVWPEVVEGAQPGDELLVYADLPETAAMKVVLTGDATIEVDVAAVAVERPLLERAWVRARIERLTRQRSQLPASDRDGRDALHKQIVELSTTHRVLSDFTALLVLESEWDYQRFGIDRKALGDILTVGATGVTLQNRTSAAPLPVTSSFDITSGISGADAPADGPREQGEQGRLDAAPGMKPSFDGSDTDVWGSLSGTEIGEAYGVGGLGLVGTGRGGGGTGEGTLGPGNTGPIGKGGGRGARGLGVPTVRQVKHEVEGAVDRHLIRRTVRAHIHEVRHCYNQALARDPNAGGRVVVKFMIGGTGKVPSAVVQATSLPDRGVGHCITQAVRRWTFPAPEGGSAIVTYPFDLDPGKPGWVPPPLPRLRTDKELAELAAREAERERQRVLDEADRVTRERVMVAQMQADHARDEAMAKVREAERAAEQAELQRTLGSPYLGKLYDVMELLAAGDVDAGLALALRCQEREPGDVLALLALGEALEAAGDPHGAARAYGSIIDLFPARADLRRYVGGRLERLGRPGLALALDSFAQAVAQRPDHPASHRMYAFALARAGRHQEAFAAIRAGNQQKYPSGRFAGVDRILREDAGLLAAAWLAADPTHAAEIRRAAELLGARIDDQPSLRFVLTWETDANDVDFHVMDGTGERAWYARRKLPSGGELFADVTTGYGPECFAIPGPAAAFPYEFQAQYYSRGPMGYGMGKLQIVQHDGQGGLKFDDRPFIIMKDRAHVDIGKLERPL